MNFTPVDGNATGAMNYLDRLITAVGKNLTVCILGITINYINATMVYTYSRHHIFKANPRFILFIHLVFNDMIQLTTSISLFILTYIYQTIHVYHCCFFMLPAILTTQNTPLNIAFMAVECYIAVCIPLRYNYLCTVRRTYVVIGIIWTLSSLTILPDVFIIFATEPLDFITSKVKCYRDAVFRSTYSLKKRDSFHIFFLVVVWFTLFYTYLRIVCVAKGADTDAKKARNTLLLHGFQVLLCMLVYVQPTVVQVLRHFFPGQLRAIYFAIFITNQILPRFASPIVYGLREKTFRMYFRRYLLCTVTTNVHPKTTVKTVC